MTTWKQLSRPLRLAIATPWCLLAASFTLALTPGGGLILDYANRPTADVSLTSTHWTGTLDPARLPASVAQYAGDQSLTTPGALALGGSLYDRFGALLIDDPGQFHASQIHSRAGDPSIDLSDPASGCLRDDGGVSLSWDYAGIEVPGSVSVAAGAIRLSADGTAVFNGEVQLTEGVSIGGGYTVIDNYGHIQAAGSLATDGGNLSTDGSGSLAVQNLYASNACSAGSLSSFQGFGIYGSNGPAFQPDSISDAADLASVIAGFNALKADLASYGLLAP